MEVLPDYEAKRFSRSPTLTNDDRKKYFKIDDSIRGVIDKTKQPDSQIGLLVQYGYFKVSGKFFTTKSFKLADIRAAAKNLGVTPSDNFIEKYTDRTRQRHRLLILDACGHIDFGSAIDVFEEAVSDMVEKQMHPRKLFYVVVEQLRQKKIELPSYDHIAKTITDKFHAFEKTVVQNIADIITPEQQEALNQLIITGNESYERALLTRLKLINQSMKPAKIKLGIRNFLIIKKLHQELYPIIEKLALSTEATKYYAQWVNKAKTTQIAEMVENQKRNLYLIAFIDHWYKLWQDTFVDMLLKAVQQLLNKAERNVSLMMKERMPEKNKLTSSVLAGFDDASGTLNEVRVVVHNQELSSEDKILKLYTIVPPQKNVLPLSQTEIDAKKLKIQIEAEETMSDQFDALGDLSRKLQNLVADIVKHLEFEASNSAQDLYSAIEHYQSNKNITVAAPDAFLDDHEYKAGYRDEKFNVSLYKALLFCKVATAIKCGQISIVHSYRYLSIDAYLLSEKYWKKHKDHLLEKLGLSEFRDVDHVLALLRGVLDKQFIDVNRRIMQGKNKHVTINIIILWNYIELTKIIMRSDPGEREHLLENITNASILTWQHVNLHGTYDFSNLLSSNDPEYTLDDVINFKAS